MFSIIWNPVAGRAKAGRFVARIEEILRKRGADYCIYETKRPGHATELAGQAVREGITCVVVVGGDGTIQEAAGPLVGTGVRLCGVPAGNGNDFLHHLYSFRTEDEKIRLSQALISSGDSRLIDIIKVTRLHENLVTYVLNIANLGLDAEVADYAACLKKRFGSGAYILALIKKTISYQPFTVRVVADEIESIRLLTLAAICNGDRYGGGFVIAPGAHVDDAAAALCLVRGMSRAKILIMFPLVLMGGKHTFMREVEISPCKTVLLEYEGTQKICLDGNIFCWDGPLRFDVLPKALTVATK